MGGTDAKDTERELAPDSTSSTAHNERATLSPSPTESTPVLRTLSRISTTESTVVYKVYKRRFFGLAQLVLLNIVVSWDWISFAPISKSSADYFHTTESIINWLSTAFLFAFVAASPVTIWALHHSGPKLSIIISAVLLLAGNWVRYAGTRTRSFGGVMFGQILVGLAQPFVLASPTQYSDTWFTEKGRVSATAVASLANPFGAALGQLIDPFWATKASDIPNMVLYISILSSVACIPSFFIPARPPTPPSAASIANHTPLSLRASVHTFAISPEFWMLALPFWIYVGFFNSFSSLLNQILEPYGNSESDAGIAGALLIFVGLVSAAISSPLIDRYKFYLSYIKVSVPLIALSYLVFIWAPEHSLAYPYLVCSILGAASFGLVPVALEFLVEIHHPLGPEIGSTVCWTGGQVLGGIFIIAQNALKAGPDAKPPFNMKRALVFEAVITMLVMPLPLCLGLFGRKIRRKRLEVDKRSNPGQEEAPDAFHE